MLQSFINGIVTVTIVYLFNSDCISIFPLWAFIILETIENTYHHIPIQIEYLIQDLIYNNEIDIISKNLQIMQHIEP